MGSYDCESNKKKHFLSVISILSYGEIFTNVW